MNSPFRIALAVLFVAVPFARAADLFESTIRPVLAEKCFGCHSEAAKKSKGKLTLDSRDAMLAGGNAGPAIVPGKSAESLLLKAIRQADRSLSMPPKDKLDDATVAAFAKWVDAGAPWPDSPDSPSVNPKRVVGKISDEDRQWWAFQPVRRAEIPANVHPVDHFVDAALKQNKLTPSAEADRQTLIRRVTLDLTGLPPTPEEVAAFVNDPSPKAYEALVDRLLASPRFGERSARFWLDLVRYADSDGYRLDDYRPDAWRYRDYVIRAFNADKPYDRFVREQIAGDELYPGDPDALVATGYLRHWIYEYNQRDVRTQWNLILDDITDTTGDVFLGMGMQCARCHDHKFDPILQKDYFRLRAFFAAILPREDQTPATAEQLADHAAKRANWEAKSADLRQQIAAIEAPYRVKAEKAAVGKFPPDIQGMIRKPRHERTPLEHQLAELAYRQVYFEYGRIEGSIKGADKEKVIALKKRLAELDSLKPPPLPTALTVSDSGPTASPVTIPKKGDAAIEPGFLTILDANPAKVEPLPNSTGRRSALAKWLTDAANPLTPRVMANRLWQQHFGKGLAANASDFGKLGDAPTHPQLLDWLASELVEPKWTLPGEAKAEAWSLKHLHRLMVTSAAYRRSAEHAEPQPGRLADPENKLLWRGGVRRLDAEQIRDTLLAVTGELDPKAGGPGAPATATRRSIYSKILRNNRDPLLDVFDAPYWFNSASSRDTTTTPVQSLLLINSPTMLQRSRAFASRIARDEPKDETARIQRAYQLAFNRAATTEEVATAEAFLKKQQGRIDPKRVQSAEAVFLGGKIPYRDGQAAEVKLDAGSGFAVPHGEGFPKGDFTIEAFVYPRTVADSATVRTVAAKWDGDAKHGGWALGVTGKQSRRKPQTVVMQLYGKKRDGTSDESALFSDQHVALNKPYYLAAAVKLATPTKKGEVTFYLKDLANDDEPLLTAKLAHDVVEMDSSAPLTLGSRSAKLEGRFDGLIDDVRLSTAALSGEEIFYARDGVNAHTMGYWQFEAKPNVFKDASGHGHDIRIVGANAPPSASASQSAWADFCHVLLNASEFFYVE